MDVHKLIYLSWIGGLSPFSPFPYPPRVNAPQVKTKAMMLLTSVRHVQAQICPNVDDCISTFTNTVKDVGHDQEQYCKQERILIKCLENAVCGGQNAKHRESALKTYRTDGQCDSATAVYPALPLLVTATILCLLLNLVRR